MIPDENVFLPTLYPLGQFEHWRQKAQVPIKTIRIKTSSFFPNISCVNYRSQAPKRSLLTAKKRQSNHQ
jgi:hypothetical protein